MKHIDTGSLLNNTQSDAINQDILVDTRIYLELVTLVRGVNERTDRRALKIRLNRLYEETTKKDGIIIKMFVNLATNLPIFERLSLTEK